LVALWEKRPVRPLRPASDKPFRKSMSYKSKQLSDDAIARGFSLLGTFLAGEGLGKETVILLLSSDQFTLMKVIDHKMSWRYSLITRFNNERWLVTANIASTVDLSG